MAPFRQSHHKDKSYYRPKSNVIVAAITHALTGGSLIGSLPAIAAPGVQGLEEMVVTARRREEQIQDVPLAVTVLSGDALEKGGVRDVEDLRFKAPALQVSPSPFGSAVPAYTIRGQRQLESILTQDPSVGIYIDEVVQQRPHGTNQGLFDIQSVQVLKGPQGTLFGRSTTGGAVLIKTNAPELGVTKGEIGVGVANYSAATTDAMANIPVGDNLAFRISGQLSRRDGYTDNITTGKDQDDEDTRAIRLSMLASITDTLQNTLVLSTFHSDNNGSAFKLTRVNPTLAGGAINNLLDPTLATLSNEDFHTVAGSYPGLENVETSVIANTTTYDFNNLTLKNIIGYREVDSEVSLDYDGTAVSYFQTRNFLRSYQFSEEVQLLGKAFDDSVDWIGGLYYFSESGRDTQNLMLGGTRANDGKAENTSKSVFAQATWHLPWLNNKLSLTAGARYTEDKREVTQLSRESTSTAFDLRTFHRLPIGLQPNGATVICRMSSSNNGADLSARLNPCERNLSDTFREPTWNLSIDYQITDDVLVYVTRRHGYRSGLFNLRGNLLAAAAPVDPETVDDIELGMKSEWDLGSVPVRLNVAAFHQDYKDIQRTISFTAAGGGLVTTVLNAASATIKGYEAELAVLPFTGLEVNGFYAYVDPSYDEFMQGTTDLSGNNFAMAPNYTAGVTARYTWPLDAEIGEVSVQANYYSQSRMDISDINNGGIDGYGLVNASLDWSDVMGTPLDLSLWTKNLTDEEYYTGGVEVYSSVGFQTENLGAPRTYGISMRYQFD